MSILYRRTDDDQRNAAVSADNPLPVRAESGEAHLGEVGGRTRLVDATLQRHSTDATQYSAGDVVGPADGSPLVFAGMGRVDGGSGLILRAILVTSQKAAAFPALDLYLFDAIPTVQADNVAWAPTDGDLMNCVGVLNFATASFKTGNTGSAAAGNALCVATETNVPYRCRVGQTSLWGILVDRTAAGYVTVASETIRVRLGVSQD